jgi:hypothetical protein
LHTKYKSSTKAKKQRRKGEMVNEITTLMNLKNHNVAAKVKEIWDQVDEMGKSF